MTPLEWLWKQLEERLGPEETKALHEAYKKQLQLYQKRKKEESKQWWEEQRKRPPTL